MKKDDALYLIHIIEYSAKVAKYIGEGWNIANTTLPEFTAQVRKLLEDKFGIKL